MISIPTADYTQESEPIPADHIEMVRDFLVALFRPEESVYIYACLREDKKDYYRHHIDEIKNLHPKIETTYLKRDKAGHEVVEVVGVVLLGSRRADSTRTKLLETALMFNRAGYSIYFCLHSLTCGQRRKHTVVAARHVFIEGDDQEPDVQLAMLEKYKRNLSAIVFSGRRSFHAYFRMPQLPNPWPWTWTDVKLAKSARHLRQVFHKKTSSWDDYKDWCLHWKAKVEASGLKICPHSFGRVAQLCRLPGFNHDVTGKKCEVHWLNPNSWKASGELDGDAFEAPSDLTPVESKSDPESLSPSGLSVPSIRVLPADVEAMMRPNGHKELAAAHAPCGEEGKKRKKNRSDRCYCKHVTERRRFLQEMEMYNRLLAEGIPGRYQRRQLHACAFTSARVRSTSRSQMAKEWLGICRKAPNNIGLSPESAVADLLAEWDKLKGHERPYLPNLDRLPSVNTKTLLQGLVKLSCPCPKEAAKIIANVLLPMAVKHPWSALNGCLGIEAKEFSNVVRTAYKPVVEWLELAHFIETTNRKYCPGERTRQYSINIAYLIYVCGFQTDELDWNSAESFDQLISAA